MALDVSTDRGCQPRTTCCDDPATCPQRDWASQSVPAPGTVLEYEVTPGDSTTDRRCAHVAPICADTEYEKPGTPSATANRQCSACHTECEAEERDGTQRSMYHPGHLPNFLAKECKGRAVDGSKLYSELDCLECPKQQQDVVFLLDFGISMETKVNEMKAFMKGVVDRMTFRSATAAPGTPSLGRVAIVYFDDHNNQKPILAFGEASKKAAKKKVGVGNFPKVVTVAHLHVRWGRIVRADKTSKRNRIDGRS